ncbi:class I SAM-dependent methyltransferase [Candidatus Chrysopegis kryptomonas]|uniref:Methyltransferase domain-containing protein n=1 Tax=Candidatus Chryseopegocella kryptomonas TaxID=1633643 RepID=A0A0P1NT66_9BACT|nr:class I SAM-dependent methyltransferase [Candidatus Chrysopegis kryptomonas]CUT02189.1 Methyltransferase domain-containing protein [Candidatus Chrysopegis kryptomonas]
MRRFRINKIFWDSYAPVYDEKKKDFDLYLRHKNLKILKSFFSSGQTLLEIGCGTGTESVEMLNYGCKLVLTDISFEMLKIARRKITTVANTSGDNFPKVINLPAEYIDSFKIQFDGAYSSFGVLNCITNIENFFQKLHKVLKPNSYFITSIINRWYWGDFLFFTLGITNYLRKRLKGWGYISLDGKESNAVARYYSINDIRNFSKNFFSIETCFALPFLLPPAYLKPTERLPKKILNALDKVESIIWHSFPFKYFGEQTVIVLKRL